MRPLVFGLLIVAVLLVQAAAAAEVIEAPIGGKPVPLGEGRVVCAPPAGDWVPDSSGAAVRPPTVDDAVGRAVDVRVAATASTCASSATTVTLVAVARWPTIDPASITLAVDDGRIDLKGRGLRGVGVRWHVADRTGEDRCAAPEADGPSERCVLAVGRGASADPFTSVVSWFPAGGRADPDAVLYDANARRVERDELALRPARVIIASVVPPDATIDLAGSSAPSIALRHPEAIASADCGNATCELTGATVLLRSVPSLASAISLRTRLLPHVFLRRGDTLDPAPVASIPVLACAMSLASGEPLRAVDDSRVILRLDARCGGDPRRLRFVSAGRPVDVVDTGSDAGGALVVLGLGRVESDEVVLTATRDDVAGSPIGLIRTRTRAAPQPRATLELESGEPVDFIPTNRPAIVRFGGASDVGRLALLPVDGVYDVATRDGITTIQGQRTAGGFVSMRFAFRVEPNPASLVSADLGTLTEPVQRPIHEANVPIALGASALAATPLVELVCSDASGATHTVMPGVLAHVAYAARDSCRVVFHRERLAPDSGSQLLNLDVDVTRVDGTSRPEAHVSQPVTLRSGPEPRYAWIRGVGGRFDRITIHLSHAADESHYVGGTEARTGEPAAQWSVIAGEERARLYATTSIPTGLYRVSDVDHSGILTLNFGVIARLTWLDQEGHEGFLGLEAGMMGMGLANDLSAQGRSLTQVATVGGMGLSVPIANRSLATETSINLHAWAEYEVSRDLGHQPGNPLGFVFGPSISIGNLGTSF